MTVGLRHLPNANVGGYEMIWTRKYKLFDLGLVYNTIDYGRIQAN
jgi:hypothetical protein